MPLKELLRHGKDQLFILHLRSLSARGEEGARGEEEEEEEREEDNDDEEEEEEGLDDDDEGGEEEEEEGGEGRAREEAPPRAPVGGAHTAAHAKRKWEPPHTYPAIAWYVALQAVTAAAHAVHASAALAARGDEEVDPARPPAVELPSDAWAAILGNAASSRYGGIGVAPLSL